MELLDFERENPDFDVLRRGFGFVVKACYAMKSQFSRGQLPNLGSTAHAKVVYVQSQPGR